MDKFEWSSQYNVGVEEIDSDHRKLLSILNMSIESVNHPNTAEIELTDIVKKITAYTQKHFQREETLMEVCEYPHIINHKAAHARLTDHVVKLTEDIDKGKLTAEELAQFLISWLIEHISEVDYYLAAHCVGKEKLITESLKHIPMDDI